MAITGYLSRVIFKEHSDSVTGYAGQYKLLLPAKSIPSPVQSPNQVDATTFENGNQVFVPGIKQSQALNISGNLEKKYLDAIDELAGKTVDIMILYGMDGVGGEAKYAFYGATTATIADISGVDSIVDMSVTVTPASDVIKVTDQYTVTDNGDGNFTVAAKS